jgi:hypothetical protein
VPPQIVDGQSTSIILDGERSIGRTRCQIRQLIRPSPPSREKPATAVPGFAYL